MRELGVDALHQVKMLWAGSSRDACVCMHLVGDERICHEFAYLNEQPESLMMNL